MSPPADMVPRMARKQSRRSISINRVLYDRVKIYAESAGQPISKVTEAALAGVVGEDLIDPSLSTGLPGDLRMVGRKRRAPTPSELQTMARR